MPGYPMRGSVIMSTWLDSIRQHRFDGPGRFPPGTLGGPIRIDPRLLIGGPNWPCPACGADALGTASIIRHTIVRRCRQCLHTVNERLPPCNKAVIYLDQFVFSNMAKVLDAEWAAERPNQAGIWPRLFDALDRALKLQLVVCPTSRIHEQESVVHKHFKVLRRLYQHFSGGATFEFPTRVHGVQLTHALEAHFARSTPDYSTIPRSSVVQGELDAWQERIAITIDWAAALPDAEALRTARAGSADVWAQLFQQWRDNPQTFEEHYAREVNGYATTTVTLLQRHLAALARLNDPAVGAAGPDLIEDAVNYRLEVQNVLDLASLAEHRGIAPEKALRFAVDFLFTDSANRVPMNEINALLFAALGRRASAGQKQAPSRGMWADLEAISGFLPYCDAMFVDNQCADLLNEEPIRSRVAPYGTRIFSTRTADHVIDYLRSLESAAGDKWRELVTRTYGTDWLTPYRNILGDQRARDANRMPES